MMFNNNTRKVNVSNCSFNGAKAAALYLKYSFVRLFSREFKG